MLLVCSFLLVTGKTVYNPHSDRYGAEQADWHEAVIAMNPAGFWPLDEGKGTVVRDLSEHGNDGKLHHVDWVNGLPDFKGAYQWIEVPAHAAYQTDAFSTGGWVYFRSEVYGGGWPNRQGMLLIGNRDWLNRFGVQLAIRRENVPEVVSSSVADPLVTRQWSPSERRSLSNIRLNVGQWHHLIYTFEPEGAEGHAEPVSADLARGAVVTASNDGGHPSRAPVNAIDGDDATQWVVWQEGEVREPEVWIQLDFDEPKPVNRIRLFGRDGRTDFVRNGTLLFSDGSRIEVEDFGGEWSAMFYRRTVEWIRLVSNDYAGPRPGLRAFEVYNERINVLQEEDVLIDTGRSDGVRGTGVLYLNGEEIGRAGGIAYESVNRELHMGNDAQWWHMSIRSGSLNGALRDMVWFDRALSADEVDALVALTRPTTMPLHEETDAEIEEPVENGDALLAIIEDGEQSEEVRARAASALAEQLPLSETHLERVRAVYEAVVAHEGAPRIEAVLSNALTRLLLDADREGSVTRRLLDENFARPFLASLDLEADELASVREAFAAGNSMDALDQFRRAGPRERSDYFFTHRRPEDRDYTAVAEFEGVTYIVGEGIAWRGVEPVDADTFDQILSRLEADHPNVREWRPLDFPHLYRVTLTRVGQDGSEETVYLGGEDFVLDGTDEKLRGWSIFVDQKGYIHLIGGQHNVPNPDYYIPGSWEAMGASRERDSNSFPKIMYWVSARPGSFDEFVFVGQRDNPRAIPADYLNYMVLLQDAANRTYLFGRVDSFGWQSWGFFAYDLETRRWNVIGGEPQDVVRSIEAVYPEWFRFTTHQIRGRIPDGPAEVTPLVWAWQPAFYNFCRDHWGARFDRTGRLHIHMQLFGLDERGFNRKSSVYAWSDDYGQTFHRANGSPVRLPLTLNPAPEHNADITNGDEWMWWRLWTSLIREAGFDVPHFSLERIER